MKITAEFNSNEEMLEFISTFGAKNWAESDNTKIAIKEEIKPKKATTKKQENVQAPKEETEKAEAENVGVDETPTETKDPEVKTVTKEDVLNACKKKMTEGKTAQVKAITSKYGAKNVASIKEEDYEAILSELEVI